MKEYVFSTASQKVSVVAAIQHPYHNPQQFEVPWNVAGVDTGGGRGGHAHGGGPRITKVNDIDQRYDPLPSRFPSLSCSSYPHGRGGKVKEKETA